MFKLWLQLRLLLAVGSVFAGSCTITIPTDLPDPQPVFIIQDSLFWPIKSVTELAENEKITLHCAGSGNTISALGKQTATLLCSDGTTFIEQTTGTSYALTDLQCTDLPESDLLVTDETCADGNGLIYESGFQLDEDFHSVFTICYDYENLRTLYARNILNGAAMYFKINDNTRIYFRGDGMGYTTSAINNYYLTKKQLVRFNTLFGSSQTFVNSTSFLSRGHLAPDADFVFLYEQLATYYYTNCAPEWQVVNAGNWLRVEKAVRKLAGKFGSDLLAFTSTLGVLKLTHPTTQTETEVYMGDNNMIAAPEYFYKVVLHPKLAVDLVFITVNNPYDNVGSEVEFCTNVCSKYNLNSSYYTDPTEGYTFCCELNDFWANAMGSGTPYFDLPEGWSYKS